MVPKAGIDEIDRDRCHISAGSNGVLVGEGIAVIGSSRCMPKSQSEYRNGQHNTSGCFHCIFPLEVCQGGELQTVSDYPDFCCLASELRL